MDSNFQYAEAVKLVVALLRRLLGTVGVLRFSSFFYERQAIRRSLAPTNIGSSPNSAHELEHSDPLGDVGSACDAPLAAYGP
jgi:hypothetical protein